MLPSYLTKKLSVRIITNSRDASASKKGKVKDMVHKYFLFNIDNKSLTSSVWWESTLKFCDKLQKGARLVVSVQTFEEFFLSRLLTCPNFSFGSCRATSVAKEEEKSWEEKCAWQFGGKKTSPPADVTMTVQNLQVGPNSRQFLGIKKSFLRLSSCRSSTLQIVIFTT